MKWPPPSRTIKSGHNRRVTSMYRFCFYSMAVCVGTIKCWPHWTGDLNVKVFNLCGSLCWDHQRLITRNRWSVYPDGHTNSIDCISLMLLCLSGTWYILYTYYWFTSPCVSRTVGTLGGGPRILPTQGSRVRTLWGLTFGAIHMGCTPSHHWQFSDFSSRLV